MEDNRITASGIQEHSHFGQLIFTLARIATTTYSDYYADFDEMDVHSEKCYGPQNKIDRVTLTGRVSVKIGRVHREFAKIA